MMSTMKRSLTCPACDGQKILHVPELKERSRRAAGDLPVASEQGRWFGVSFARTVGHFEAFVCVACGYSELYANSIDELIRAGGRIIDNEPKATLR
jgi:hypothetical protein